MRRALEGIQTLKNSVDTLIIIPNERLKAIGSKNASFKELIVRADEVLLHAVKGISDLIMSSGFINLDFADVKKVMAQMGNAIMGTGRASGENRAMEAAQMATNSPLLEDISIAGSRGLLMNLTGPHDMTMEEIDEASTYIKGEVHPDAEIFWGVVFDDSMGDEVQVTTDSWRARPLHRRACPCTRDQVGSREDPGRNAPWARTCTDCTRGLLDAAPRPGAGTGPTGPR